MYIGTANNFIFFELTFRFIFQKTQLTSQLGIGQGIYGKDVAFAFVNHLFTRKLFKLVTWSGLIRNEIPKERFSQFTSTIRFFYELIYTVDNRYTMAETNKFLMEMIQNSGRRYRAWLASESSGASGVKIRESRCKRRTTLPNKIIQPPVDETVSDTIEQKFVSAEESALNDSIIVETNNVVKSPASTDNVIESTVPSSVDETVSNISESNFVESLSVETMHSEASAECSGSDSENYGPFSVSILH